MNCYNKFLRLDRDLEPDMCVTVEPGIYFVPAIWECEELTKPLADVVNRSKIDALLKEKFGGIRLEDTVRVRADDKPEILSAGVPTDPEKVLKIVGSG